MIYFLRTLSPTRTALLILWIVPFLATAGIGQTLFRHPPAGSIYRDYSRAMIPYASWRVTDPGTQRLDAQANLPNAVLPLSIADLQGATRAEAIIDIWGGHWGTTGKKIRFNNKAWIPIPEVATTPTSGECYSTSVMITVDVPIGDLKEGTNTFEGTNTGQTCYSFDWGQHGQFGIIVRVFYDASKPHPAGSITSPLRDDVLGENPIITTQASGPAPVDRVEIVAFYDGYDVDGDGIYQDWQYDYHRRKIETDMEIHDHVGTALSAPYVVTWNTASVPDQEPGSIKLQARIRNTDGVWFVTDEIPGLTVQRSGSSVKLYRASGVPDHFSVRSGGSPKTCSIVIPPGADLSKASQVRMLVTTWNGTNKQALPGEIGYTRLNSWTAPIYGADEHWSFDAVTVPLGSIVAGTNVFTVYTNSSGFGISIQWPGPALLIRYDGLPVVLLPGKPSLIAPANGAPAVGPDPVLSWDSSGAATSFRVQLALDSAFSIVETDTLGITGNSVRVGPLAVSTQFFWRVRGENDGGPGPWSDTRNFVTSPANPSGVTLLDPIDGATQVIDSPSLRWRAVPAASGYWIQLTTDSAFSGVPLLEDSTLIDTSKQVMSLEGGMTYFWRLSARTAGAFGPFSLPWKFTTALGAPAELELLTPADNATIGYDTIYFRWRRGSPSVETYWFELGFDPGFAFRIVDSTLTDTTTTVSGIQGGRTFYWRARARNAVGWGTFSPVRSFVRLLTTVGDRQLPREFALEQNYPNPFNPSTQIAFALPVASHVRIEVSDILGSRVGILVDGLKQPGRYVTDFDGAGLPSGIYLCRMRAGNTVLNRKMLLLK